MEAEGTWRELTDMINEMLENFTLHVRVLSGVSFAYALISSQVRSVSEVAKAVTLGDLGIDVELGAQGELLDMKYTINAMVARCAPPPFVRKISGFM